MSENPELEGDEEQVNLDPDPAPEDGLGEGDFAPFDHTDSYTDVDPNYVPIVDPGGEPDDGDEDLTDEEAEPPEEEDELVPYWASYEMQGRNLDEGTAWQNLATEPFSGELDVEVEGLTAGARWEFRLRLVDRNGQRSRWSEPLQISLPTDFTPPPAPTAPSVDENTGYITSWWDGELTGDMPKDFSHIVKYLQQMHPDGDPDGEPGDPYRFSTMSSAGAFSVGFLLADVQYRTWYTAVDTSGNESPWSDIVEFTPSQAFNTEELEEDLRKLNQETLPALESSLTTKANEATQAVEDFRTEWDESGWNPEAIDELRGRADATEAEVATAKAEAEQAKQDAATAQANAEALEGRADATDAEVAAAKAEAEQAKQDAKAAQAKADALEEHQNHLEATLAEKASASELNELDGILRGSVDLSDQVADKFYGNMAVVSRLQAEEGWIGGVALGDETVTARHVNMEDFTADRGFIDNAFVRLIEGELANYDQGIIGDVLLKNGSVFARHVRLGHSGNMLKNGDLLGEGSTPDGISSSNLGLVEGAGYGGGNAMRTPATTSQSGSYFGHINSNADYQVPIDPGESYRFSVWAQAEDEDIPPGMARIYVREYETFGTTSPRLATVMVASNDDTIPVGEWRQITGIRTAHEDAVSMAVGYYVQGAHNAPVLWSKPTMVFAGDASMTINGLLQASTGQLQELFFDTAVGNAISLGVADIIQINADRINSNSWTGQVMTGPVMQSHTANNRGWRIEPGQGLRMWDNSGAETIRLDGTDNYFAGRLHAGMDATRGVLIDYGPVGVHNGWNDEDEFWEDIRLTTTPHLEFHTHHDHLITPKIWVSDNGHLTLTPGVVRGGERPGTIRAYGRLWANRVRTQNFEVPTTSDAQPGGMRRDGPRTRLHGRTPSQSGSLDMFTTGSSGPIQVTNYYRNRVYWANPPETGTRRPVASVHITLRGMDGAHSGYVTTGEVSAESFRYNMTASSNHGWNMWVYYNCWWS